METIKSRQEFEQVFREGRRASHRLVRLTVLEDMPVPGAEIGATGPALGTGKVAFVAARRLGSAVYRNRCKRVLREAARSCGWPRPGRRVILFATRATHDCTPAEVAAVLPGLLDRCSGRRGQAGSSVR